MIAIKQPRVPVWFRNAVREAYDRERRRLLFRPVIGEDDAAHMHEDVIVMHNGKVVDCWNAF